MKRRSLLLAGCAVPIASHGEHPWQPTAGGRPLYLEGTITMILWADPHPHLELLHRAETRMLDELRRRSPAAAERAPLAGWLPRIVVPPRDGEIWRIDLPTLARISAQDMPRPKIGDVIGVVGLPGPPMTDTPTVRAEILLISRQAFTLRSAPPAAKR